MARSGLTAADPGSAGWIWGIWDSGRYRAVGGRATARAGTGGPLGARAARCGVTGLWQLNSSLDTAIMLQNGQNGEKKHCRDSGSESPPGRPAQLTTGLVVSANGSQGFAPAAKRLAVLLMASRVDERAQGSPIPS